MINGPLSLRLSDYLAAPWLSAGEHIERMKSVSDMILAIDVQYESDFATVGGVIFETWTTSQEFAAYRSQVSGIEEYVPGEFFRRELPCILQLLTEHALEPDAIVVDGFVYLDGVHTPGLGKHLFDTLGTRTPVVGVAKNRFATAPEEIKLYRGKSKTPLYVTSAGIPLASAKEYIASMHGRYRIPTMLKKADQTSRGIEPTI